MFLVGIVLALKITEVVVGVQEAPGASLYLLFFVAYSVFGLGALVAICAAAGNLAQYIVTGVVVMPYR